MNKQETESLGYIPGRAPSEVVWERIENHLNKRVKNKFSLPVRAYAVLIVSLSLIGFALSVFFA